MLTPEEQLLLDAKNEIERLRMITDRMGMRLEIYDNMMSLFKGGPAGHGSSYTDRIDIVFAINERLKDKLKQ